MKKLKLSTVSLLGMALILTMSARTPQAQPTSIQSMLDKRAETSFDQINKEFKTYGKRDSQNQAEYWNSDRGPVDVILRRTEALLNHVEAMPGAPSLAAQRSLLNTLKAEGKDKPSDLPLFKRVSAVQREIAMANPLLDFDSMIFTGHESNNPMFHSDHMSYLALPDNRASIYMVSGFKGDKVEIKDLLEKAVVQDGRYKGQTLSNKNPKWNGKAGFISPSLSYDGKELLFAWTPWSADAWKGTPRRDKFDSNNMFRIFAMNLDGSDLRILADHTTPYDDYDPIHLPDGRILFVSDRHNGGQRCGSIAVSGNFYSMKADGTDIYRTSWHETNERRPFVDYNGKIVYSRWDYIDRHAYSAQGFWVANPDLSDPRAYHGNYIEDDKPFHPISETDLRPIPGSPMKYTAVEAGHHKAYFGNLVVIDISKRAKYEEQIRHFWPGWKMMGDSGHFNENQRFTVPKRMFRTPVPLGEDFVIVCEFSEILLIDKFRNEIMLFDSSPLFKIRVASPIPVKSRAVPPAIPYRSFQGERRKDAPKATIAVMNVYESDFEWPKGTKITHLRINQIVGRPKLPWETPRNVWIGYSDGALIKNVLGTVPVEEDGSAYFEAPIEREIYFQAVDETGMAVMSMLSGTNVRPGEQLYCVGCHEDKWTAPQLKDTPIALRRAPSKITPGPEGSIPLTYARLAQPVFEKNCVPCHKRENKGIGFEYWDTSRSVPTNDGKDGPAVGKLAKYITYYNGAYDKAYAASEYPTGLFMGKPGSKRSRSIPNQIGARACELLKFLGPQHHPGVNVEPDPAHKDVKLSREDFHRVTLWLDMNANELGTYDYTPETAARQRRGEVVWPEWPGGSAVDPKNPTGVQLEYKATGGH